MKLNTQQFCQGINITKKWGKEQEDNQFLQRASDSPRGSFVQGRASPLGPLPSLLGYSCIPSLLVSFQRPSAKAREETEEEKQFRNIFRQIAGDVSMQPIPVCHQSSLATTAHKATASRFQNTEF